MKVKCQSCNVINILRLVVDMNIKELKRLQWNREYFENGCLCISKGELPKLPCQIANKFAVSFYENNCCCSRNYVTSETPPQDLLSQRGTGRSWVMVRDAPRNAFIVVPSINHNHYMRQLVHSEGRIDLKIVTTSLFVDFYKAVRTTRGCEVLFDHSVFELVTDPRIIEGICEFIKVSNHE